MTDYISREATKAAFAKNFAHGENENFANWLERVANEIIERVPKADVQPIKCGRWVDEYLDDDDVWCADCTNCKNDTYSRFGKVSIYAYCPNCGARMDLKDSEKE